MNSVQLKANFHTLIDNFQNEDLLSKLYEVLSKMNDKPTTGKLWNKLTPEQQQELIEIANNCNNPENYISHEEVMKKYGR